MRATGSTSAALTVCVAPNSLGHLQLVVAQVDGDDRLGAGERGALDAVEADAAAAEHRDRPAGLDTGGVEHRADPGHHAAADQRRLLQRDLLVDRDDHVLGHDVAVLKVPSPSSFFIVPPPLSLGSVRSSGTSSHRLG